MTTTISIAAAAEEIVALRSAVKETNKRIWQLEQAVMDTMRAEGLNAYPHPDLTIKIEPGDPYYDVNQVRATLGELLDPATMTKLIPSPDVCKDCRGSGMAPERVSGTQANVIRKIGGIYAEHIDAACTRSDPRLVVKAK